MKLSISKKLILPVLILVTLAGAIIVNVGYYLSANAIGKASNKTLLLTADFLSKSYQIWTDNRFSELKELSIADTTIKSLGTGFLAGSAKKSTVTRFENIINNSTYFKSIQLINNNDVVISHFPSTASVIDPDIKEQLNIALTGELTQTYSAQIDENGDQLSTFIVPINNKDGVLGVLVAKINITDFSNNYFEPNKLGFNTFISLIDTNGESILSINGEKFQGNNSNFSNLMGLLKDNAGIAEFNINNNDFIIGYSDISNTDKKILVSISRDEVYSEIKNARMVSILITIVIVLVVVVFLNLIIKKIVSPILIAKDVFKDLAGGQGDLTKRLPVASNDEIGEMATHFNDFIHTLNDLIVQVNHITFNLSACNSKISEQALSNQQNINKQNNETDLISSNISEISSSSNEVSQLADDALKSSNDINAEIKTGQETMNKTVLSINNLAEEINQSKERVDKLSQASSEIDSVISVINSIAEQTNLLALNAAIEAARAGDQGRGFAVVADEVRTLAQRTQESVVEINKTVEILQSETKNVQSNFESSHSTVKDTVTYMDSTRSIFDLVTKTFTNINGKNSEISTTSNNQSKITADVNDRVVNIKKISEYTSDSANQLQAQSENLTLSIDELNQVIARFKINQ
ncbi:MAG: methyl-accepting chemotaxis protein [Saccharospirillaceae bacterium]|nr:methyl-accepting chemotaxis protein [Pseudomonadales bacterium]NRB80626.1 methyl-accepting chemotaxis protein [Saccharospirillaceae bacterium]